MFEWVSIQPFFKCHRLGLCTSVLSFILYFWVSYVRFLVTSSCFRVYLSLGFSLFLICFLGFCVLVSCLVCQACFVMSMSPYFRFILKESGVFLSLCWVLLSPWRHYVYFSQLFPHAFPLPLVTSCVCVFKSSIFLVHCQVICHAHYSCHSFF